MTAPGLQEQPGLAEGLALAAAPTFAAMALLTGLAGDGAAAVLCASAGASPLGGMVTMYLLMSAFHVAPWLRRVRGRGRPAPEGVQAEPSDSIPERRAASPAA